MKMEELNKPFIAEAQPQDSPGFDERPNYFDSPSQGVWQSSLRQLRRVGPSAWLILIGGTSIVLAVVVLLTFLWFANVDSPVWHRIAIHNWMAPTVTISTLILRAALGLQVGIVASMLSGLSLEKIGVRTSDLASSSIIRSGHGSVLESVRISIVSLVNGRMPLRYAGPTLTLLLLLLVSVASQFASTLLVNDLRISAVRGILLSSDMATSRNNSRGMSYVLSGPAWEFKPSMYPSFDEYFETNSVNSSTDGIIDTGTLLRAFLPFQN